MSVGLVVDCSMTMAWCFGDESTPAVLQVQDHVANEKMCVPVHWYLEVTNVLALAEKKHRIKPQASDTFLSLLQVMDIHVDFELPSKAFAQILALCRKHHLTSYDAAYLELALRRKLPLATLDDDLRKVAKKLGVVLLGK